MGELRNEYKILVGKPGKMGLVGRQRHKLEENIVMNLKEVVSECGWYSSSSG
jgi:hypothetical protein